MRFNKREQPKKDELSNFYLKIKDGESVNGVFRGEIFEFYQAWPKGGEKQIFNKPTAGASSRFKANFIVHEQGKFIAKVWEFPVAIYNQLADVNSEYDLSKTKIKITRQGTGTTTRYMILPLLREPLNDRAMKEIESVELIMLGHKEEFYSDHILSPPLPESEHAPTLPSDDEDLWKGF